MRTTTRMEKVDIVLDGVVYDRDRWTVRVFDIPEEQEGEHLWMFVDTKHPDPQTGLFSTSSDKIKETAFDPNANLRKELQTLMDRMIGDIEALPPPTMEEALRLRNA